jgi:hypothetical protein
MEKTKRPRGRPTIPDPATLQIHFRVTAAEKAKYQQAAAKAKATLTGWLKALADRESS